MAFRCGALDTIHLPNTYNVDTESCLRGMGDTGLPKMPCNPGSIETLRPEDMEIREFVNVDTRYDKINRREWSIDRMSSELYPRPASLSHVLEPFPRYGQCTGPKARSPCF